eukprot:5254406-Amphidinium_carterae.1
MQQKLAKDAHAVKCEELPITFQRSVPRRFGQLRGLFALVLRFAPQIKSVTLRFLKLCTS